MPSADMAWYMRRRYRDNRQWAVEYLGGKCAACDAVIGLEFDHIDPLLKEDTLASLLRGRGRERLKEELDKCQLLCTVCHRLKHESRHGTRSRYVNRKCRCDDCREAAYREVNEWKQRHRSSMARVPAS